VTWVLIGCLFAVLLLAGGRAANRRYWNWRIREFRYRQAKAEVKQSRRR
jgi:hypothetical protein